MSAPKTSLSAGRPSSRTGTTSKTVQDLIGGDDEELERVNFEIPKRKKTALKVYAVTNGRTLREIFEEYVDTLI